MTSRHTLSDDAMKLAIDAYSWAEECDRREAERSQPQPVVTQCVLLAFSFSMFLLMLALFGTEPW